MVDRLHELGFKVTLWVMPFAEEGSAAYREGAALGHWVTSEDGSDGGGFGLKPGFFRWWNSAPAAALDVTSPKAVAWFASRLRRLQAKYGIDGFKFDAGEPCFLPRAFKTHVPLRHPSEYTRAWVASVAAQFEMAEARAAAARPPPRDPARPCATLRDPATLRAKILSPFPQVRTGQHSTGAGMLTRMGDRFSEWGVDNGLQSIIPTLLTSGVLARPPPPPPALAGRRPSAAAAARARAFAMRDAHDADAANGRPAARATRSACRT